MPRFTIPLLAGLMFALAPESALADCTAPSGVCVRSGEGVGWKAGEKLSNKQRAKEARKNRKRSPVVFYLTITGGRGSVFIDGEWVGSAPIEALELKPGKHDVQVRDGANVLAAGVLVVPKNPGANVEVEVQHRG